ncbi:MAG: ATP-binding protein [Roseburia sp.]|nr:ATP-binding protein [Roseburia sp.]
MVLAYLRLGSLSTDYVFKKYALDDIIRQALRKFAGQFIGEGIKLEFTPSGKWVVTDEKWLSFVIEQLLSNALKYTRTGSVCIMMEEPDVLCIRDTGIGIAPEDLPRIFERGYTGYNGRRDKKASGLGLYLCQRVCKALGHEIRIESVLDSGTTVRLRLEEGQSAKL